MWNKYPYINYNDLNLDFIFKAIKEMEHKVNDFVSLNAIKYANPIQWNITRQYEKNTIVIEPNTGVAYISVKAVPAGVAITRPEYWTVVFDLSEFITKGAANFANTFEAQPTTTATKVTPKGGWVVWNETLYVALDRIDIGDAYAPVEGGNIKHMTVEDFFNLIVEKLDGEIQDRVDADEALGGRIDDEIQNRVDADEALGGRIDDEIQNRVDADEALGNRIDNLPKPVYYNVLDFGAVGDGSTDDTDAIQSTINRAYNNGGGVAFIPATGHAYKITSLEIKSGVMLQGVATNNYEGMGVATDVWTRKGTWLLCTDTSNEAIKMFGHGCSLDGINLIYEQPTPTVGWRPTQYPYAIKCTCNHFTINQVFILGATHGVNFEYLETHGGCTDSSVNNLYISTFDVGIRFINLNDTIQMNNVQIRGLWYHLDSNVVNYINNNLIGIDCYYCDNIVIDGLHIFDAHIGIAFHNSTCLGNTHSLYNCMITNAQFNLNQYALKCDVDAIVTGSMTNIMGQVLDSFTGQYLFDLNSPYVNITFTNLNVPHSCGLMRNAGDVRISGARLHYGHGGMPCFALDSGTIEIVGHDYEPTADAGTIVAGSNANVGYHSDTVNIDLWSNISMSQRSGTDPDVTTSALQYRPAEYEMKQFRLIVKVDIDVFDVNNVFRVSFSGLSEATREVTITSTGQLVIDTGWVNLTYLYEIGYLYVGTNNSVTWRPYGALISFRK